MIEPTSALLYMARDYQKRYGAPCRVSCSVDSSNVIVIKVEVKRGDAWVAQADALPLEGETRPHVPGRSTAP